MNVMAYLQVKEQGELEFLRVLCSETTPIYVIFSMQFQISKDYANCDNHQTTSNSTYRSSVQRIQSNYCKWICKLTYQHEVTYTSRVFSGIWGGRRVKADKNQHATHTKIGTPDLQGNDRNR